ncbi:glycerophosphodiester phosphodiesterase GDPD4-like isoform X2 [Nicotiana tabacum]|uniref:glycerophosphodiester phosphodiesterase n=1 Tax=Nicotiana tabacum TaxID=4097 RepID=A0A1S4C8C1_TOBAC|nr:glycerophosphodiester phosphodiesterase GDPD4 isoform X2 [Nicotiana tomentosiformis]XP_016497383.1 PREDICTED: glycerophosphodiester phosphodiesterase GDPD4-like isoform X2 [Nicotiana tabacum]
MASCPESLSQSSEFSLPERCLDLCSLASPSSPLSPLFTSIFVSVDSIRCNHRNVVGCTVFLWSVLMVVIRRRPFPTLWLHTELLLILRLTALRLMFLVLQMVCCLPSMTGRDLQRITGNNNSKVSHLSSKEIKELDAVHQLKLEHHDLTVPTVEDALKLISGSVRRVILDAKVGPPLYEKEFAKDLLSIVNNTGCKNCLVWAKSDSFSRDVMKLSSDVMVGYIVMVDPSTGTRMKLLRFRGAAVVGVYHPLIDENLMKILHGRNKKVYAWTVDDEDSMKKMLFERVDAIVTSNPSLLQRLMQDVRTQCFEEGFSLST